MRCLIPEKTRGNLSKTPIFPGKELLSKCKITAGFLTSGDFTAIIPSEKGVVGADTRGTVNILRVISGRA